MPKWTKRFSLSGRTALVTGASKGIGFEIARVFADAGADIVAVARDPAGLEALQADVRAQGRHCVVIEADLADKDEVREAAARALEARPRIDILVNSAGIALIDPLLDARIEDFERTIAVNLRAPFLLAQALAPQMIARRSGKIINISSQTGVIAADDHAIYAASKGALNALTKSMACEWAHHNIQINAICPTVILTPMGREVWGPPEKGLPMKAKIPAGRFGEPVEVADMALYLASPASDFVNGHLMMLDGGFTAL